MVIPDRWEKVKAIQDAIKLRHADAHILGDFDFHNAERKARARVHLVRIDLSYVGRYGNTRSPQVDPFELWFNENFKLGIANEEASKYDIFDLCKDRVEDSIKNELVNGSNLITALESLYQQELQNLLGLYKNLESLDPVVLSELNVSLTAVKRALRLKIEGLKDIFWKELFDRLDKITTRLTTASRQELLKKLTEYTHVDFTASNAYAIVVWVIKNANQYFDDQLIRLVESMTSEANIENYVSNQRTFGKEQWRYGQTLSELARYKLDYRIVLHRSGGLCTAEYNFEKTDSGLSHRAGNFLDDIRTVASNLGFDTSKFSGAHSYHWSSNVKSTFLYHDMETGKDHILFEAKAYKNGNIHLKLNQAFICRLNVEFGRLKGWLKSPKEAAEELGIPKAEAAKSFASNLQLEQSNVLALEFQRAA